MIPARALPVYDAPSLDDARATLRRVFGHPDFRGLQAEVIAEVLAGRDALAVLPTGGGKSVCYQIPALLRPGVGLVVSPLIALMQDQVAALRDVGVRAGRLDSSLPAGERLDVLASLAEGQLDLLYVSPEGLMNGAGLERLSRTPIALIAIDEAHCVSQWGHDFRPDYRALGRLKDIFPGAPRLAVTATADPATQADIRAQLRLEGAATFVASFDRPNLVLSAERKAGPAAKRVVDLAAARKGQAGIVYAATRDGTETLAEALAAAGLNALAYHAGLDARVRAARLAQFQAEDDVVMAATVAFGMGVDKPDVRFVIHADPPKSIEAYWQEVGRAGRDGLPAEGVALYGPQDLRRTLGFIDQSGAEPGVRAVQARKARQLFSFLDAMTCRRAGVRRYFGETDAQACGQCDICLDPPAAVEATQLAAKLLSAVIRMDQRFGRGRVIDHVLGKPARDGLDADYATRSTYGCGKDVAESQWRAVLDQLLFDGVLVEDGADMRPTLKVADPEATRAIFKGARTIAIRAPIAKPARREARGRGIALAGGADARFAALKTWRRETAIKAGTPPYVIFHDAALAAIAEAAPKDLFALSRIAGVGEKKLERYGAQILALLEDAR